MPTIYSKEVLGKDRVIGFYDTPLRTVEYMCSTILSCYQPGKTILDPAVGDGVFLEYLLSQGVRALDLHGYDIDEEKVAQLKDKFPNVRNFDSTNPFDQSFDFILGNPPYNGDESHFVRENRARLEEVSAEIGAKNTFSIITYQAIKALTSGGRLVVILSDAFLTNTYYKPFRQFLLKNLRMEELLLAPWKLFHGRSADVRTCILTGTKKAEWECVFDVAPSQNEVKLVDRLAKEDEYRHPPKVEFISQHEIELYPNQTFLVGISKQIRDLYLDPPRRLGDIVQGGTGISTGNDRRFLRKRSEVENDPAWVRYYKNGARQAYAYEPEYWIERDYRQHRSTTKNYLVRNEQFFFKEGITCSSVGVRFSAAFLPPDSLFGVNANFFFSDRVTLFYILALLNTKLAWYFARRVLIRTNNISANYLRLLPLIEPPTATKEEIAKLAERIVEGLRQDEKFEVTPIQAQLDNFFFDLYRFDQHLQTEVLDFCNNFYERL